MPKQNLIFLYQKVLYHKQQENYIGWGEGEMVQSKSMEGWDDKKTYEDEDPW